MPICSKDRSSRIGRRRRGRVPVQRLNIQLNSYFAPAGPHSDHNYQSEACKCVESRLMGNRRPSAIGFVDDRWYNSDGTPSGRHNQGKRYRAPGTVRAMNLAAKSSHSATSPWNPCGPLIYALKPVHRVPRTGPETRYGDHKRKPDRNQPSRRERHRTSAWDRPSTRLRATAPFCEQCGATTDLTVAHIMPLSVAPELALEPLNCRVLCRYHNSLRQNHCTDEERQAVLDAIAARARTAVIGGANVGMACCQCVNWFESCSSAWRAQPCQNGRSATIAGRVKADRG
jgi:5-methylcytosine-specific restriction endonuclease McrA